MFVVSGAAKAFQKFTPIERRSISGFKLLVRTQKYKKQNIE
jgi:hypothetical protein